MTLLYLEEIARRLQGANLSQVSKGSGLSRPTLTHLRDQSKKEFTYETVVKISHYLQKDGE